MAGTSDSFCAKGKWIKEKVKLKKKNPSDKPIDKWG